MKLRLIFIEMIAALLSTAKPPSLSTLKGRYFEDDDVKVLQRFLLKRSPRRKES